MHENEKNNAKGRVIQTYWLRERETFKKFGGKRQKILCGALPSQRERKRFEKFLKKWFEQVKYEFF